MARGGVIGRIGPEMTPECDCTGAAGAEGADGGAAGRGAEAVGAGAAADDCAGAAGDDFAGAAGDDFAGAAAGGFTCAGVAGLAATGFAAGLTAMPSSTAFGACTATDAVISAGWAVALVAGFAAGFTLGSGFGATAVFGAAGVSDAVGLSEGLGLRAEVNFFTVAGLEDDSRVGFDGAIAFEGGGFLAVASLAGFAGGGGALVLRARPAAAGALPFAAVLFPPFPPTMPDPNSPRHRDPARFAPNSPKSGSFR